ncbi:MAG: iron transporter [Candidatus Magasanikbacteria bacterium CG_4_9_14_3_um_filter_32_9]|uniref:Iron transporter n=1 Tax=Candidatus Magasanikbacteria bacterium CG_4_9_14_3_um_filter_32_9 TaxID=1974644 RepID=A0A2M7Z7L4_9BACT|nr:MAG: iron transporter [Candidatus Magasanikbacteria bacterium CG_4_9_14_3_um_filter_32_9]
MNRIKKFLKSLGPGFITGASDDDPSGIGTYSQTGSQFGYNQLWTALFSFPFMAVIQEMCGRIGMVTGKGLSNIIRHHYSKKILYISVALLFLANTVNVGADLGAMAASGKLLLGIPFILWLVIFTAVSIGLQIFVPYPTYAKFLKYLTLSLFAYVVVAFVVKQPWHEIALKTFIPSFSFSKQYLLNIVAILGTTISPYLFFWEADQEAEEDFAQHRLRTYGKGMPKVTKLDIRSMRIDTVIGMLFSNLIMFFIIVTAASTLGANGITNITTADQAAMALRPLAGDFAYLLFAVGIIGTGLLAIPILAGSAGYALSEAVGWKAGLGFKFKQAHAFYTVIIISTIFGALLNFVGIPPFRMLYYTAVLNGVVAPPLMIMLMLISNNKKILGEHINKRFSNIAGWVITAIMSVCALALLITLFV